MRNVHKSRSRQVLELGFCQISSWTQIRIHHMPPHCLRTWGYLGGYPDLTIGLPLSSCVQEGSSEVTLPVLYKELQALVKAMLSRCADLSQAYRAELGPWLVHSSCCFWNHAALFLEDN